MEREGGGGGGGGMRRRRRSTRGEVGMDGMNDSSFQR